MKVYQDKIFGRGGIIPKKEKTFQGLRLNYALTQLQDKTGPVLEIGCGAGRVINSIKHYLPKLECYGCDRDEHSIKLAIKDNPDILYQECNVQSLPYEDNQFPVIIGYDIFEHLPDINRGISEVIRVLSDGGILIGFIPLEGASLSPYRREHNFKLKQNLTGHIKPYTYDEVISLFSKDFEIINTKFAYHLIGSRYDLKIHKLYTKALEEKKEFTEPFWLQKLQNIAYYESKLLKNSRFGAMGMLFTAKNKL